MKRVIHYFAAPGIPIEIRLGKSITPKTILSPYVIFDIIEKVTGFSAQQLIGKDRHLEIANARHITAYFMLSHCDLTLKSVGKILGGRDHSTVLSSKNAVENLLASHDGRTTGTYNSVINLIKAHGRNS